MIELLQRSVSLRGSDVFIVPGASVAVKVNNDLVNLTEQRMAPADTERLVKQMYELAHRDLPCWTRRGTTIFPSPS